MRPVRSSRYRTLRVCPAPLASVGSQRSHGGPPHEGTCLPRSRFQGLGGRPRRRASRNPTDVVVKVDTTTICGTDLHILHGDVAAVTDGRILGHEAVGTVTEVGDAVNGFAVGDRVLVPAITKCGRCEYCQRACPRTARPSAASAGSSATSSTARRPSPSGCPTPTPRCTRCPDIVTNEQAIFLADSLPDRLRGRRARREGPARQHRRRRRCGRGRPVRHPHHRPVGRLQGHRDRHEQVPAGEGARVRRDRRHRGRRRAPSPTSSR